MINRKHIGHCFAPHSVEVEQGQLKFFAKATGETNPIYLDVDAARVAGHPALPAPPTFAFCLTLAKPDPFDWMPQLGVDLSRVLHGEQHFNYTKKLIYAGDRITLTQRIADIYDKKGGTLEFIVLDSTVTNQHGDDLGSMRNVTVMRTGDAI
jgi:acyl dehydratase